MVHAYLVYSTLSLCMLVCMDRRHASAGMRIWRKLCRLVATKRKYPWAVAYREPGEREVYLPQERDAAFPSRDPGRDIPVRVVSEQGQLDTRPFEVLE